MPIYDSEKQCGELALALLILAIIGAACVGAIWGLLYAIRWAIGLF